MARIEDSVFAAIDPSNSVWVTASAGSGKTTLLMRRVIRLLMKEADFAKIICITYTNTAAAEIKERIFNELSSWMTMEDTKLELILRCQFGFTTVDQNLLALSRSLFIKLLDKLDQLNIYTIHSFCQQILRKFFNETDIARNYRIIDELESKFLINAAIDKFFLNIDKNTILLEKLNLLLQEKNEFQLRDLVQEIIKNQTDLYYIRNFQCDYKADIKNLLNLPSSNKDDLINEFFLNLPSFDEFCHVVLPHLTSAQQSKFFLLQSFSKLSRMDQEVYLWDYIKIFLTDDLESRVFNSEKQRIQKCGAKYLNLLENEQDRCFNLAQDLENIKIYNLSVAAIEIGLTVLDIYQDIKTTKSVLDYNDLLLITYKILTDKEQSLWRLYKLSFSIKHILIDEAQDTSELQWLLIKKITEDFFAGESIDSHKTLFVVGDEKQSIFKFQGASPEMFYEMFIYYRDLINNANKSFYKLDLNRSYRSLPNILKFTNNVFNETSIRERITDFDTEIKHNCTRNNEGPGAIYLWPLTKIDDNDVEKIPETWPLNSNEIKDNPNKESLAKNIAKQINLFFLQKKIVTVRNSARPIQYGDIMILLQKRDHDFIEYLIKYLNQYQIPNSGCDRLDLLNEILIQDILALFRFCVFPNDDLNLANIIKSPILGLSEDDLFFLCEEKNLRSCSLFDAVCSLAQYEKTANFLKDFILKSSYLTIYELYIFLLNMPHIKQNMIDRFANESLDLLNEFRNIIINYETNNLGNLYDFIYAVDNQEIIIKKNIPQNTVKIMTIHSAKGLQAPIVFLVTGKFQRNKDILCWLDKVHNYKLCLFKGKSKIFNRIYFNLIDGFYNEYIRLFYVAITRAANELYICGFSDKKNINNEMYQNWYQLALSTMQRLGTEVKFTWHANEIMWTLDK